MAKLLQVLQNFYPLRLAEHHGIRRRSSRVVTRPGSFSTISMARALVSFTVSFQTSTTFISANLFEQSVWSTSARFHKTSWLQYTSSPINGFSNSRFSTVIGNRTGYTLFANASIPSVILRGRRIGWAHSGFRLSGLWNVLSVTSDPFSDSRPIPSGISLHKQDALFTPMHLSRCGLISRNPQITLKDPRILAMAIYCWDRRTPAPTTSSRSSKRHSMSSLLGTQVPRILNGKLFTGGDVSGSPLSKLRDLDGRN